MHLRMGEAALFWDILVFPSVFHFSLLDSLIQALKAPKFFTTAHKAIIQRAFLSICSVPGPVLGIGKMMSSKM